MKNNKGDRKGNSLAAMEVTRQILGDKSISDLSDEGYEEYLKEFKSRGYSEEDVPKRWDGTSFRHGSRKGGPTHDQLYDFMEFISEPYIVTDKYFDGYNKDLNDLTSDELDKVFQELKQRFPEEHKEYVDSLYGAYLGSRKGDGMSDGNLCKSKLSGKGSRPESIESISRDIVSGMNRSLTPIYEESRKGSVGVHEDVIDYLIDNGFVTSRTASNLMSDLNKILSVHNELNTTLYETLNVMSIANEYNVTNREALEYYKSGTRPYTPIILSDQTIEEIEEYISYTGSREGSRKGQDFTSQGITNTANAFRNITTSVIPEKLKKLSNKDK